MCTNIHALSKTAFLPQMKREIIQELIVKVDGIVAKQSITLT